MKTFITKLQVVLFVFLFQNLILAQDEEFAYRGGNSDGFAFENIGNNTCDTPYHAFAYLGGDGDGASVENLINSECSTAANQFPYMGGSEDGAAIETIEPNNCDTPYHFYAFFGGNADGFASEKTEDICPILPPEASFTASKTTVCINENITFTDTSTNIPTIWQWTFMGGNPETGNTKTVQVSYSEAGVYPVKLVVTNYNGSSTLIKEDYITVVQECSTLGTGSTDKKKTLLYPNPTKNILFVETEEEINRLELYDFSGRKIKSQPAKGHQSEINLENLSAGAYLLKIETQSSTQVLKVIKKD